MSEWNEKLFEEKLQKSLTALIGNFGGIRAGIASSGLIENVAVEAYGQKMKLSQISTIDVSGNLELTVRPYDVSLCDVIQKGIQIANLGLNCSFDGSGVIVRIPPLTEAMRKDLARTVDKMSEDAKVAMRHSRREEMDKLKANQKDKIISEDILRRSTEKVQKMLDKFIEKIELETEKKRKQLTQ